MTIEQNKWEDLTVYRPLTKEELKPAYKDFTKIIADNLSHFGFKLIGRKLIKLSNDLLHVIHLDTRGSWSGIGDTFEIEIALVPVCDTDTIINGLELTGSKKILDIIPRLRNHYRITQEYKLLADFITRKIIDYILPYFDKYDSSGKVIADSRNFKSDDVVQRNENLILYSELLNHVDKQASSIIARQQEKYNRIYPNQEIVTDYFKELNSFQSWLKAKDWQKIDSYLQDKKDAVLKKLKINASR